MIFYVSKAPTDSFDDISGDGSGNYMYVPPGCKFVEWTPSNMLFYHPNCSLKFIPITDDMTMLNHHFIFVTPMILTYGIPLLLDENMAKLFKFYDCGPMKMLPQVVLIYAHVKLFE